MKRTLIYIYLIAALLILVFGKLSAQNTNIAYSQIEQLKQNALTESENRNYKKAENLILDAHKKSLATDSSDLIADIEMTVGDIYNMQNKKEQALPYYYRATQTGKLISKNNETLLQNAFYKIGLIYFEYKAYQKTIENFNKLYDRNYNVLKYTGLSYDYLSKDDSASMAFSTMKQFSEEKKDTLKIIESLDLLINLSKKQKEYETALDYNYELYNIYLLNRNTREMGTVMNNIGYLNVFLNRTQDAMNAFLEAEKNYISSNADSRKLMDVNVNLGVCAHNLGKKSESVRYLIDALDVARNNKDDLAQARINNILAVTYYQNKDMYNAAEFSLDAINAAEKSGNNQEKKEVYLTYSSILQSLEDYQKALDYFKKHLLIRDSLLVEQRITDQKSEQRIAELERLEKELRLKLADEEVQNVLLGQMKLESEKKEQELELYRREQELKSAENERMMQSLAYEKQKRQAVIREQQIKALEQENEIRNLELERKKAEEQQQKKNIALLQAEREKQSLEIEKQAEKEKTFYYIVIFGFLIFILILLFLINSRKKNKRLAMQKTMIEQSNHELNQLNEEISSQKENLVVANNKMVVINREITDSIRYAKRIQKSVLKSPEVLGAGISDYFIYFKPKDIVSGDFYWSKRIGNKTIIAAADCTGHGVPGAFMSMLGISFLNEIAGKQNNLDNAAVILDELREKVKESLQQTGKKNEQKDGMDIALIIIDPPKNQLHFAGANNPMLIIRKNELVEIKGDRMPIGIHHKEANFKNNTLEIKKGDVIYTYSDGFQDQFGGSAGRKFMTRRFREFLVSINEYPMPQQSELIQQTYDEWVSHPNPTGENFPQMDDILIIGLKIE